MDLFTGGMSWRELDAYLKFLPMESATWTEQRDSMTDDELADMAASSESPRHGPWAKADFLLAEIKDEIARLIYIQTAKAVKDPKSVPQPEPRRRPGVTGKRSPRVDPKAVAYLEEIRERNRRSREAG